VAPLNKPPPPLTALRPTTLREMADAVNSIHYGRALFLTVVDFLDGVPPRADPGTGFSLHREHYNPPPPKGVGQETNCASGESFFILHCCVLRKKNPKKAQNGYLFSIYLPYSENLCCFERKPYLK